VPNVREDCAAIVQMKFKGKRTVPDSFPSSYKLWIMTANIALVLKIRRYSQAGLGTTFHVSDSSYIWN
jgi:hypothetical protein